MQNAVWPDGHHHRKNQQLFMEQNTSALRVPACCIFKNLRTIPFNDRESRDRALSMIANMAHQVHMILERWLFR